MNTTSTRIVFLDILPISMKVLLVRTPEGYRLSDGNRFSGLYRTGCSAMDDEAVVRALTFGEEIPAVRDVTVLAAA